MKRKISIKSKRKGISIHSIRSVERSKTYAQMNRIERELLALNLVTGNLPPRDRFPVYEVKLNKVKKGKKSTSYTVKLPKSFLGKDLHLYKVRMQMVDGVAQQAVDLKKVKVRPTKSKFKIRFSRGTGPSKKNRSAEPSIKDNPIGNYFALVNPGENSVRVHGMKEFDHDPEIREAENKALAKKKKEARKSGETISNEEMKRILDGAANYCERLKQSAFHFFCQESIVENRTPLDFTRRDKMDIRQRQKNILNRSRMNPLRKGMGTQVNKYVYTYRLIKNRDKIKEEREWLSSMDNIKKDRNQVVKPQAFLSSKAVFAPITLLDRNRQSKYKYTFQRYAKRKGRRTAVLEAVPKDILQTGKESTVFGLIWVDMEDFSVLKIEAYPESIRGYNLLKKLALKLRTRIYLSLETEFDHLHDGIRFPTQILSIEKYKGGRMISRYKGNHGWERTRTFFNYKDYRFFNVKTEVSARPTTENKK